MFVILLAAVRICLYMRCFFCCTGKYRLPKKIMAAAFVLLWIFEGFIVSISKIGRGTAAMDLFFLLVEIPVLTVFSFGYQAAVLQRLLPALFLPAVYWTGKWSIAAVMSERPDDSRQYLIVTAVSVLLLFIFEIILEKAGKSRQEREREMLEQEIRFYENQFALIRQSQHRIRALKHDMKHHMKMLADMVSAGERESALEYLASMGHFMENSEEYTATGNDKIDSICNYMIARAKNLGIDVSWNIQIPEHLEIPVFDINVILSNLFENAINALADVQQPSLYIQMKYDRGVLLIRTQNNYPERRGTGDGSMEHGFGLKNIRRTAQKYHGSLTTEVRDGEFHASVLLFLEDGEIVHNSE